MKSNARFLHFVALTLCAFILSGCAGSAPFSHTAGRAAGGGGAKQAGNYKIGNPYRVGSVTYAPQESFDLVETGIASWYGPDFHGGRTANGEIYDQNELTAAHRTLQMPSFVRVTNLENGKSVVVRVNDRGPYLHGRIIDMSKRGAELLGFAGKGTARVRLEVLGDESRQIAEAARRGVNTSRMTLADMSSMPAPAPIERGPQVASLQNDAEMMPESLQTPMITVEDLSSPGKAGPTAPPTWTRPEPQLNVTAPPSTASVPVHIDRGRAMPDPVVTTEPVRPTGIFVQAGSFSVYDNAARLTQKLSSIANASVEPVNVNGRKLYRVRLGPIASVAAADSVLEKVIRAGNNGAKVIKN